MDPGAGVSSLHRIKSRLVETMVALPFLRKALVGSLTLTLNLTTMKCPISYLTCEVQFGVLPALPLLYGALHRERELHHETCHV